MAKKFKRELSQSEKDFLMLSRADCPPSTDISVAMSILIEALLAHERQFINTLAVAICNEISIRSLVRPDCPHDSLKGK